MLVAGAGHLAPATLLQALHIPTDGGRWPEVRRRLAGTLAPPTRADRALSTCCARAVEALKRAENALDWFINDEGECDAGALEEVRFILAEANNPEVSE